MMAGGGVVTVGTFDGVHRGHQAVLAEITGRARRGGHASVVVTFDPHPLEVVNAPAAPRLLTTTDEKRALLAAAGIDRVAVLPFTRELSQLGAAEFVALLEREYGLRELVLGYDHGFGRGREGDTETVRRLGRERGFAVDVVEAVREDGQPISSSLIRTAVAHGDLDAAARWIGRRYTATGRVEHGAGRGRAIGFPTANVRVADGRKLLPPDGVYAVRVTRGTVRLAGVMNQGPRPTFGVTERGLEVHVFDFSGDLVGEMLEIEWVRRLREVRTFASRDALVAQITEDARAARACLHVKGDG